MFFFTNGVAGLTVDGGRATARFNHYIAWKQMAAHRHDAGFNFRDPTATVNAIAVRRMLDLLAPNDANSREPALARWTAIPLHWMCTALTSTATRYLQPRALTEPATGGMRAAV